MKRFVLLIAKNFNVLIKEINVGFLSYNPSSFWNRNMMTLTGVGAGVFKVFLDNLWVFSLPMPGQAVANGGVNFAYLLAEMLAFGTLAGVASAPVDYWRQYKYDHPTAETSLLPVTIRPSS